MRLLAQRLICPSFRISCRSPLAAPYKHCILKQTIRQSSGTPPIPQTPARDKETILKLLALAKPQSKIIASAIGLLFISSAVTMVRHSQLMCTQSVPFSMGTIIDMVLQEFQSHQTLPGTLPGTYSGTSTTIDTLKPAISLTTLFGILGGVFVVGAAANTGRIILFKCAGERCVLKTT